MRTEFSVNNDSEYQTYQNKTPEIKNKPRLFPERLIIYKRITIAFDDIVSRIEFKNDFIFFRNNVKTPEYRSTVKTDSDNNSGNILNIFHKKTYA